MYLHTKVTFSLYTCSRAHFPFLKSFLLPLVPIMHLSIGGSVFWFHQVSSCISVFLSTCLLFVKLDSIRLLFKNILAYFHNLNANNTNNQRLLTFF